MAHKKEIRKEFKNRVTVKKEEILIVKKGKGPSLRKIVEDRKFIK